MTHNRVTVRIPAEYLERIKESLHEEGYATVNELLLDLLRHRFDLGVPKKKVHKNIKRELERDPEIARATFLAKARKVKLCKHGAMKGNCKFGCR